MADALFKLREAGVAADVIQTLKSNTKKAMEVFIQYFFLPQAKNQSPFLKNNASFNISANKSLYSCFVVEIFTIDPAGAASEPSDDPKGPGWELVKEPSNRSTRAGTISIYMLNHVFIFLQLKHFLLNC